MDFVPMQYPFQFRDAGLRLLGAGREFPENTGMGRQQGREFPPSREFRFEFADLDAPLLDCIGLLFFELADRRALRFVRGLARPFRVLQLADALGQVRALAFVLVAPLYHAFRPRAASIRASSAL